VTAWRGVLPGLGPLRAASAAVTRSFVLNGVPLDARVAEFGPNRDAIDKMLFDARRKLRAELVANGYLDTETQRPS
jgi:RNA polymerase sigma-70 factor, ECF subfamily